MGASPIILRRHWRWVVTLLAGTSLVFAGTVPAHAADALTFEYDASGTTHIASTDSDIILGPSTLTTELDVDTGELTATLPLPGTTTTFDLIGFIPVTADVAFIPVTPIQGQVSFDGSDVLISSTATYHVKLSNVRVAGFPTFAGEHCRTIEPVTIPADTPEGETFSLLDGGRLVGSYTIGAFQHCGLNTWLINAVVPGSGNTIELQASNGRVAS